MSAKDGKTRYKKPCPDLPEGQLCPLCGARWVCTQPDRKLVKPAPTKETP